MFAAALLASGCEDTTGEDINRVSSFFVETAEIHPAVVVGDTLNLIVSVFNMINQSAPGQMVAFEATSGSGFTIDRTVRTDDLGKARTRWVIGTVAREQTVTVSVAGQVQSLVRLAVPAEAAFVDLPDTTYTFAALEQQLTVPSWRGRDRYGNEIVPPRLNWLIRDTAIARGMLSPTPLELLPRTDFHVWSRSNGATWLIGMGPDGGADSVRLSVQQILANIGILSSEEGPLSRGQTRQYTAIGGDGYWYPMPLPPVTWSTTDTLVATIDASGKLTARATGMTLVVAQLDDLRAVQQLFVDN